MPPEQHESDFTNNEFRGPVQGHGIQINLNGPAAPEVVTYDPARRRQQAAREDYRSIASAFWQGVWNACLAVAAGATALCAVSLRNDEILDALTPATSLLFALISAVGWSADISFFAVRRRWEKREIYWISGDAPNYILVLARVAILGLCVWLHFLPLPMLS
ncbi:hypothetical protein ACFQVC_13000 [Streptomyces monticola]|uniref:Uncharacterized protein n=1 Tax=Streptomyces monticola TaxID=2666263 RepID=A0ABW2JHW2_9ACTN